MTVGAVAVVPVAVGTVGDALFSPTVLLVGFCVAVLSSAVPYACQLVALRRLPASTFSVLMTWAPAVAAGAGFLVLGQSLTTAQCVGTGLVVVAGIGAVRTATRPRRSPAVQCLDPDPGHVTDVEVLRDPHRLLDR